MKPKTIKEFAEAFDVSYTTVRRWIAQKRLTTETYGQTIVILDATRPDRLVPGDLGDAGKLWNHGRKRPRVKRKRAKAAKPAPTVAELRAAFLAETGLSVEAWLAAAPSRIPRRDKVNRALYARALHLEVKDDTKVP